VPGGSHCLGVTCASWKRKRSNPSSTDCGLSWSQFGKRDGL